MFFSEEERIFIDQHRVARLASADASGAPHVIPIVYARLGDLLYSVIDEKPKRTRTGLQRLRNIAANARVAVLIDDYDEDWTQLAYLLLRARAELVGDPSEYAQALAALRQRYQQYTAMALQLETHPMVRLTPLRRHLWRATAAEPTSTKSQ